MLTGRATWTFAGETPTMPDEERLVEQSVALGEPGIPRLPMLNNHVLRG